MSTMTAPGLLEKIGERIQELEPDIQKLARRWSMDHPDDWEDQAQEVRLAIYQKLEEEPDSPRNYLFQVAKRALIDYRRKGKSVDGKLHRDYGRRYVWLLVTLDGDPEVVPAEYSGLYVRPHQLRPVEDLALAEVVYGELVGRLTGPQARYLALRLQGLSFREVHALMGMTEWQGRGLRAGIKRQAREVLQEDAACTP